MTVHGKNTVLSVASICVALMFCEFTLRAWLGMPFLSTVNFRDRDPLGMKNTVRYDSRLGWTMRCSDPERRRCSVGDRRTRSKRQIPPARTVS